MKLTSFVLLAGLAFLMGACEQHPLPSEKSAEKADQHGSAAEKPAPGH